MSVNQAIFRVGHTDDNIDDGVIAQLALACAIHARSAVKAGWACREFDGDAPCTFCVENARRV